MRAPTSGDDAIAFAPAPAAMAGDIFRMNASRCLWQQCAAKLQSGHQCMQTKRGEIFFSFFFGAFSQFFRKQPNW